VELAHYVLKGSAICRDLLDEWVLCTQRPARELDTGHGSRMVVTQVDADESPLLDG
jgi:hypothetical protein